MPGAFFMIMGFQSTKVICSLILDCIHDPNSRKIED